MKSPTYWDIAQKAGVSTATVSFAMGSNLRKVSVATRDRVVKLATEMGYRPNPLRSAWQAEVRSRRALPVQAALGF
ncbi:MAG: LacI family DNA-binding transcriptional regulator, partial [Desulfuromonadales bacterium]|nr:LacI family DNA-binding transcriptional regulator [Desulfuromonadales bacterium]